MSDQPTRVEVLRANILRRPRSRSDIVADVLRVLGLVSVIVAAIGWGPTEGAVLALVLLGLVLARFLGASSALDIGLGVTLLVAGWSSVVDVYRAVVGWDLLMHFLSGGLIAALAFLLLAFFGLVQDPDAPGTRLATVLILTTSFGLAASAVWEMLEWMGHTFVDERIFVGYDDSIGDMALGGLGALAAGIALRTMRLRRPGPGGGPSSASRPGAARPAPSAPA